MSLAQEFGATNLWRRGDTLEEILFACRHGARIEESDDALREALSPLGIEQLPVVWAANAHGLGAPASLLRLEFRHSVDSSPPIHLDADGLHLTSPRLAAPLLKEWFPDVASRTRQLAEGFELLLETWLTDGEPQIASWFLRRLLHNDHFAVVISAHAQRKALFRELYARHRKRQGGQPALELLSTWLEVGNTFRLRPDSVEDAADILEKNALLPPNVVTDLWQHGERRKNPLSSRIQAAATKFFQQTQNDTGQAVLRLYRGAKHMPPALAARSRSRLLDPSLPQAH